MTDVDEFYDEATEEFPSVNDLVPGAHNMIKDTVDGRLVAIWAISNGRQQKKDGTSYPYTETLTLVMDDGLDGKQFTELIGPAPQELKLRYSTGGLVARLSPRVDGMIPAKKDEDGKEISPAVPQRFRPMVGRINARPSKEVKNGSPAISISKVTGSPTEEADKAILAKYRSAIVEINERLEAKAQEAEDAKAFE